MTGERWRAVRWTEAQQVLHFMGHIDGDVLGDTPDAHYRAMIGEGPTHDAVSYLAHALPRMEVIGWAARILKELSRQDALHPRDRQALDAVLRWLDEPSEQWRRSAQELADMASDGGAEQLLAMAVFVSGGSIAPPELPAVLPPDFACNRLAGAAVKAAAYRAARRGRAETEKRLQSALQLGETFAVRGMEAFAAA